MQKFMSTGITVAACIILLLGGVLHKPRSGSIISDPDPGISSAHTIQILNMRFQPAELIVKKGDKVIFVNKDLVLHDVTESTKKKWSSGSLKKGSAWALVINKSSSYYCSLHPVMKGKILVK